MKKHNLEANYNFIKALRTSKKLGEMKLQFYGEDDTSFETKLRGIWYKKQSDEYKSPVFKKRITLTEYKTNLTTKIKIR